MEIDSPIYQMAIPFRGLFLRQLTLMCYRKVLDYKDSVKTKDDSDQYHIVIEKRKSFQKEEDREDKEGRKIEKKCWWFSRLEQFEVVREMFT